MINPQPLSPIHAVLEGLRPTWSIAGTNPKSVRQFDSRDADRAAILGVTDLSQRSRAGVKGSGAAGWLSQLGIQLPPEPNSWCELPGGGLIARLGLTEYLVENDELLVDTIMQTERTAGVYPVLRQDAVFALCGSRVNELLLQTCNVDFRILKTEPSQVVLTSMAGVGVTVLDTHTGNSPVYQIWCDGTYGIYLLETLIEIAQELGGGCIGLDALP